MATLNEFTSPGPEELHSRVLKELADAANVLPIFKKGKKKKSQVTTDQSALH